MDYYKKELNPSFWDERKFDSIVRKKLLTIANEFFQSLEIQARVFDAQLTGSMSNFNWTELSDLDVHILIDFTDVSADVDIVKSMVDSKRFIWNLNHEIMIRGHEVEIYVQDVNEPHISSGLFSLLKNEWVVHPMFDPPQIDERDINVKVKYIQQEISKLKDELKNTPSGELSRKLYEKADSLKHKIMKMRKEGLQQGGEYSVGNLSFKKLRNTNSIEELIDLIVKSYDNIYSEQSFLSFKELYITETGRRERGTGFTTATHLVPKVRQVDNSKNGKIESLKKRRYGKTFVDSDTMEYIRNNFDIYTIPKGEFKKLGSTGISIAYDYNTNKYILIK